LPIIQFEEEPSPLGGRKTEYTKALETLVHLLAWTLMPT